MLGFSIGRGGNGAGEACVAVPDAHAMSMSWGRVSDPKACHVSGVVGAHVKTTLAILFFACSERVNDIF